jgi:hypothetical protein
MWFFLPDELPALALIKVKGPANIQDHRHDTGVASAFLAMGPRGWDLQLLRFHFTTIPYPLRCKNCLTGSKPVSNGCRLRLDGQPRRKVGFGPTPLHVACRYIERTDRTRISQSSALEWALIERAPKMPPQNRAITIVAASIIRRIFSRSCWERAAL